jgi:hypothetical protein
VGNHLCLSAETLNATPVTSEFVACTTPEHDFLTAPCRLLTCRLCENNNILLRSRVVTRNPMQLPEIQPRMFHALHQQYVGDEYPRAPALRSASPTIGR